MSTAILTSSLKTIKPYVKYIPNLTKPILRVIIQCKCMQGTNEDSTSNTYFF